MDGTVIAIDTFLGSPEHWDGGGRDANLMPCKNGRPLLYERFLTNVVRTGMQDLIVPLPQSSEHAAIILSRLGIRAGLIHIDAAHEFDPVMRDVLLGTASNRAVIWSATITWTFGRMLSVSRASCGVRQSATDGRRAKMDSTKAVLIAAARRLRPPSCPKVSLKRCLRLVGSRRA